MAKFMIAYLWEDLDARRGDGYCEVKFGDHFVQDVSSLEEAFEDTRRYVRSTLGRQKHKFDHRRVILHHMWDVSKYSRSVNRFKPHGKVDDEIRHVIGHHLQADIHTIDAETAIARVNNHLIKHGQPLPKAGLSTAQYNAAINVLSAIENGATTILAELCPRLGKTIWAGAVSVESDVEVVIIVSYVLTSFASFQKDLTSFSQFVDFVHVDTKDTNYQEQIRTARRQGKRVIAYLSMCSGGKRQERVDFLFGLQDRRLIVIDEADFGIHKPNQVRPLKQARKPEDVVILMTGTNGDRAASEWSVDHYLSVTYPELVIEKRLTLEAERGKIPT
jgi:hypothetical protein